MFYYNHAEILQYCKLQREESAKLSRLGDTMRLSASDLSFLQSSRLAQAIDKLIMLKQRSFNTMLSRDVIVVMLESPSG